jgi:hypothetical protein
MMDPAQEILILRAEVAMLRETSNSVTMALRACEEQNMILDAEKQQLQRELTIANSRNPSED